MTAPETGREIPADEMVERLRRYPYPMDLAADLIEAQAARIASLEAERARTESDIRASEALLAVEYLHELAREMTDPAFNAVLNLAAENWHKARSRALAAEKGGQADG